MDEKVAVVAPSALAASSLATSASTTSAEPTKGAQVSQQETAILKQIQVEASRLGARVFRNNNGLYWAGTPQKIKVAGKYFLPAGALVLYSGRPVKAGTILALTLLTVAFLAGLALGLWL